MADAIPGDPQALRATVDRGFEIHESGDLPAALDHYDAVLAFPPSGSDPVTVESLFAARFDRAVVLTELGELERAAEAYRDAAAGLPADDPEVQHEIAMASVNRGICLTMLERHDEALAVYDEVVERFAAPSDPVTREQVTKAMVNRSAVLEAEQRWKDALVAADAVLEHLASDGDLWAHEQRAMALRSRAVALRALDRPDDAVEAYRRVHALGDGDDVIAPVRAQVAAAMAEHAELLHELGRDDEALALLSELETRYGADDEPQVVDVLAQALREQAALLDASGELDRATQQRRRADELQRRV